MSNMIRKLRRAKGIDVSSWGRGRVDKDAVEGQQEPNPPKYQKYRGKGLGFIPSPRAIRMMNYERSGNR